MTREKDLKICKRCTYDSAVPGISFEPDGVCNYCRTSDLIRAHAMKESGNNREKFLALIKRIKREGRGRKFDCLVPFSGGLDSSYVLYKVRQYGLRPLAYTIDNGWVSDDARLEMDKLTSTLGVPLRRIGFDWEGLRELYVASIRASIPEVCLPCQAATYSAMYRVSREERIKYVFFGLSPMTEGIAPLEWGYIEGSYLRDIARKFAGKSGQNVLKELNRLNIRSLAGSFLTGGTRIIQLPLYEEWDEDRISETLKKELGWIGGQKHFDCRYSPFKDYFIFKKFGFYVSCIRYAALARSGRISREAAMEASENEKTFVNGCSVNGTLERLGISEKEFEEICAAAPKSFRDYRTYYPLIRKLKWLIWLAARMRILPETAYAKFFR